MLTVAEYSLRLPTVLDGQGRALWRMKEVLKVYIHHADYATGRNSYPSYATIAELTSLPVRSIPRIVRAAVEADLLIRDGNGPGGTARYHLNLLADFDMLRKPFAEAQRRRSEKAAERWQRYKLLHSGVRNSPVVEEGGVRISPVVDPEPNGPNAYQPSLVDQPEKETTQPIADAADATPHGTEVALFEAPLLTTPKAAEAAGVNADKVRRLVAEGKIAPDSRDARGRAAWSVPSLRAQLAAHERANRITAPVLSGPITAGSAVERTPEARKAGKLYDPALWPQPRPEYYDTDRGLIVQKLVGEWFDAFKAARNAEPGNGEIGRAGKEIRQALVAGNNPNHVWEAVKLSAFKGSPWVWGAMEETHRGRPATAPATARKTGTVAQSKHGTFDIPHGLAKGDENDVHRILGRDVLRDEHWEQLDRLGVRKIG